MHRIVVCTGLLLMLAVHPRTSTGESIPIFNPSFESQSLPDGFWIDNFLTGWLVTGFSAGPQNWTDAQYPGANDFDAIPSTVPDGRNSAFIRSPLVSIQQTLTATLQPNTEYRLDFFVGDRFDCIMPYWSADLFAGSTELAFNDTGVTPANGQWLPASVSYTTGPTHPNLGEPLHVRFFTYGFNDPPGSPGLYQVSIDNIRLTATVVPEPWSIVLAIVAFSLAFHVRRSVRRQVRSCGRIPASA